ncbi:MAG: type IV pilus modification protein PilV [Gammaproteobacteria bacterium]|nr:type IV pilus modification protein PilV [Gammaproteobacteria bacterium]
MFRQKGFTLIEALVAFLILSVGMLGIASLQLISLKAGHTAELRTVAVIKAEEMFERIRNNPVVLDPTNPDAAGSTYISSNTDTGTSYGCKNAGAAVTMCSFAQIAQDDIYNWKADLLANMPGGTTASIDVVPKSPGPLPLATVTITINWKERNQEAQTMDNMSYSAAAHICDNTTC